MCEVQCSENPTWYVTVITRSRSSLFHIFWLQLWLFCDPPFSVEVCCVNKIDLNKSPKQIQWKEWTLRACFWKSVSCDLNTYCKIKKGKVNGSTSMRLKAWQIGSAWEGCCSYWLHIFSHRVNNSSWLQMPTFLLDHICVVWRSLIVSFLAAAQSIHWFEFFCERITYLGNLLFVNLWIQVIQHTKKQNWRIT